MRCSVFIGPGFRGRVVLWMYDRELMTTSMSLSHFLPFLPFILHSSSQARPTSFPHSPFPIFSPHPPTDPSYISEPPLPTRDPFPPPSISTIELITHTYTHTYIYNLSNPVNHKHIISNNTTNPSRHNLSYVLRRDHLPIYLVAVL